MAMNLLTLYGDAEFARGKMQFAVQGHGRKPASECIQCGACEKACPQHIHIIDELETVRRQLLDDGQKTE